ncbi:hypothetical protein [Anaerotignum sp.]|uniref:hypothetical protein n=1 Tax=Anaerotignum sp. TaxID=2039241 RepID=UPI0028A0E6C8|nr:hypothetical protein [Anaerotignum sp.]
MKKNTHLIVGFICCIILISALVYSFERYGGYFISTLSQPKLSNQLIGTYTCGENTLCSLTAGPGKVFYLEDYQNDIFLEGTFENKEDNVYLLQCKEVYLSDTVMEEQAVICKNLSFNLKLGDFTWNFTKISETPSKPWFGSFGDFVKEYAVENGKIEISLYRTIPLFSREGFN